MIRNIVFDMGQVLIRWEPEQLMANLNLSREDAALLKRNLFGSVQWVQLDRGILSEEAAAEAVCATLPPRLWDAVRELTFNWWKRPLVPMPGMEALIRELKSKGYGIYLLSNASIRLREYFGRIPGSDCFDGLLVSAEEKLLKPQHEIFETLCSRFSLRPEECFFIDDSALNIEGAICAGLTGTIFRGDTEALRKEMKEMGLL